MPIERTQGKHKETEHQAEKEEGMESTWELIKEEKNDNITELEKSHQQIALIWKTLQERNKPSEKQKEV